MNHKRKKPKAARAGCAMCKPHKQSGTSPEKAAKPSDRRRMAAAERMRKMLPESSPNRIAYNGLIGRMFGH